MVATTPSLRLKIADRLPHRLENFPVTETSKPHTFILFPSVVVPILQTFLRCLTLSNGHAKRKSWKTLWFTHDKFANYSRICEIFASERWRSFGGKVFSS